MTAALTAELKRYLENEALFTFGDEITEDTDLFKAGVLDSFGYVSLMNHVQQRYGVELGEQMLDSVLVSLSAIVKFVEAQVLSGVDGR
ncbi:Acyl carrier protein [Lentzea xinjiangensis]|uniref:Acyl carrier protein n=1 Tax=Lentzea xinjiangensis TaxID=402600 RepID=A0A1H9WHR7_9PSEU|nr:acyl carrier protein [Lentzea xinjiangensis]SES33227.1 Acyl carrier protein [Lentzea xinjiangensis]